MTFFKKKSVTSSDEDIQRLEMKVNVLLGISAVQGVALTLWIVSSLLVPSMSTVFIVLLAIAAAAYVFRNRLPSLSANVFRFFVRRMSGDQNAQGAKTGERNIR